MNAAKHVTKIGCDALCSWLLSHAVSLHVGARHLPSLTRAGEVMQIAAASHLRAMAKIEGNMSFAQWPI